MARIETGSTSDATTEQGPSDGNTEERDQRSRHTKTAINSGLGLSNDDKYQRLYATTEQWLTGRNLISKTHRLMAGRTRVQEQLSAHLVQSQKARKEFPKLVDALRSTAGQEALQELIYKACSNYRRRLRNKQRGPAKALEVAMEGGSSRPLTDHVQPDSRSTEGSGSVPSDSDRRLSMAVLSVVRPNGVDCVLGALHDIAPSWWEVPRSAGDTSAVIKGLSFETLLCILEKDHSYRRNVDRLGCVDSRSQGRKGILLVEDDLQLRAVVTRMLPCDDIISFQIVGNIVE
jgi:hypothetical protein